MPCNRRAFLSSGCVLQWRVRLRSWWIGFDGTGAKAKTLASWATSGSSLVSCARAHPRSGQMNSKQRRRSGAAESAARGIVFVL
jgi:hypothetical protein